MMHVTENVYHEDWIQLAYRALWGDGAKHWGSILTDV
jgi:hypothetical protein